MNVGSARPVVLLAVLLVALTSCDSQTDRQASVKGWARISLGGPTGNRSVISGPGTDSTWVLTCPTDAAPDVDRSAYVTRIKTADLSQTRFELTAPCAGKSVGAVGLTDLALSPDGFLIGIAGKSIFAYDTTSGDARVREAAIPPSSDPLPDFPTAGLPTGVASSKETAWVSIAGSSALKGWDWATNRWRNLPISPLRGDEGSIATITSDTIALAGRVPGEAGYRVAILSASGGTPNTTSIPSRRFSVLSGTSLVYFGVDGQLTLYDSSSKTSRRTGPVFAKPPGAGPAHWSFDAETYAGPEGSIWFADYSALGDGEAWLQRIDSKTGAAQRTALPDVKRDAAGTWRAPHGRVIVDAQDRPWLLNAGVGHGQADLYLLETSS